MAGLTSGMLAVSGGSTPSVLPGNCVNMGEFGWRDKITRQPCSPAGDPGIAPGALSTSPGPSGTFGVGWISPVPPGTYPTALGGGVVTNLGGGTGPTDTGTYSGGAIGGTQAGGGSSGPPWGLIAAGGAVLALLYFGSKDKRRRR
jgi:hypothetical protein